MFRFNFFILFALFPIVSIAQNGSPANVENINVTVDVIGTTEMITINTIDFENIESGNSVINVNPIQSPRAGKMIARGNPGSEFRLNYLRERELTGSESGTVLFFTYQVAGNSIDEQESAELLDQEVRELVFNSDGEFYIWVGGTVDLSEVEPGNYEGEFTIEIEYI